MNKWGRAAVTSRSLFPSESPGSFSYIIEEPAWNSCNAINFHPLVSYILGSNQPVHFLLQCSEKQHILCCVASFPSLDEIAHIELSVACCCCGRLHHSEFMSDWKSSSISHVEFKYQERPIRRYVSAEQAVMAGNQIVARKKAEN